MAQAAVLIATCPKNELYSVYNVANGEETDIRSAVTFLFSEAKQKPSLTFSGNARKGDPERWRADASKLASIGYIPATKVDESLVLIIAGF